MPVLPRKRLDQIDWFEQRIDAWVADPAAIGLTAPQVADLQTLITNARASYTASQQARNDSRSATVTYYAASDTLASDGSDLIATIKAFAEASDDKNVYAMADVPPPASPTPAGAPAEPKNVTGTINSDGAVELKWTASLAHSTFFEILRKLDGQTTWTIVDSVGAKAYLDNGVPPGTTSVQYRVRAKRGGFTSVANDAITIRLGVEAQTGDVGLSLAA